MYSGGKDPAFWTGGNDLGSFGSYYWVSIGQWFSFTDWSTWPVWQPSWGAEHCVELRRSFGYKWNNYLCAAKQYFICETIPTECVCYRAFSLVRSQWKF